MELLTTPYVEVDLEILERNIEEKTRSLSKFGIAHRPHIKTHKNTEIAAMQLRAGAAGITASKLGEAQVFYDAGFDNILIAYNILGRDKLKRFAAMHRNRRLLTTVDSAEVAAGLSDVGEASGKPVEVLVELNLGENRCGVPPGELADFAQTLKQHRGLKVSGAMSYRGGIYGCRSDDERAALIAGERDALLASRKILLNSGFPAEITSAGSTVASCHPRLLEGVSEIRCGNYVFNDLNNLSAGSAAIEDCAMRVVATVVSLPAEGRATLDVGSKTLSSDRSIGEGFGLIGEKPNAAIESLNEEHAMVRTNGEHFFTGERVSIIPNHSCVVANLANSIYGFRKGAFEREFIIEARGLYN